MARHNGEVKRKSTKFALRILFGATALGGALFFLFHKSKAIETAPDPTNFPVSVTIEGLALPETALPNETVAHFLERLGISYTENDILTPDPETILTPNVAITLETAKRYSITTKAGKKEGLTTLRTIGQLLDEQGISLGEHDLVTPDTEKALTDNVRISVIQVDIRREVVKKPISFEIQESEDPKLSWRKRVVTQKGEKGTRQLTYEIISHDGKEIKRTLAESVVIKEPIAEVATQGTKVEVGKSHTGLGSWYSFTGTLSAANPWLPIGSYVRVTNTDNGKSVIVRINDRGPFGKNRIIDLDKVAFKEIASLGAGVIPVKMEEITN